MSRQRRNGAWYGGTGADEEPYKGVTRKSNDCSSRALCPSSVWRAAVCGEGNSDGVRRSREESAAFARVLCVRGRILEEKRVRERKERGELEECGTERSTNSVQSGRVKEVLVTQSKQKSKHQRMGF